MTSRDRLLDLLATRATEGLSTHDSNELERSLPEHGQPDTDDLELAAAAAYLALDAQRVCHEPMPARLRQKVLAGLHL